MKLYLFVFIFSVASFFALAQVSDEVGSTPTTHPHRYDSTVSSEVLIKRLVSADFEITLLAGAAVGSIVGSIIPAIGTIPGAIVGVATSCLIYCVIKIKYLLRYHYNLYVLQNSSRRRHI